MIETAELLLGETYPTGSSEDQVSGAIWDYIEVRFMPSSHLLINNCSAHTFSFELFIAGAFLTSDAEFVKCVILV